MVALLPRENRISLGIDTFPRAILWSALLLFKATKVLAPPNSPYSSAFKIGANDQVIEIQATLPYDREKFVNSNGDIVSAIVEMTGLDPYQGISPVVPSGRVFLAFPENEDSRVNTLEKFFVWCCQYYDAGLKRYRKEEFGSNIRISFLDERLINGYPSVVVRVVLPYSYTTYCCRKNLIEAVYELFIDDSCAQGVFAVGGGYILLFEDGVVLLLEL